MVDNNPHPVLHLVVSRSETERVYGILFPTGEWYPRRFTATTIAEAFAILALGLELNQYEVKPVSAEVNQ